MPAAGAGDDSFRSQLGFSAGNDYYNTGKMGANWGTGLPLDVMPELMARGQQRFNINCAVCHGAAAAGDGIVKQYGLATVVSLQQERIRAMADGEIFDTITHGKNTMMAYGPRVPVADRWAIISYLRALQRSQNASASDVPAEHQAELEKK
jgi:mono/diheme cytochrome c family protein